MAIGPVGNVVFVNQQTATVSAVQGNQNTRFDLQNVAVQAAINEKEEEVQEVRPTEENHEVDPDREHQSQENDEEQKMSKKKERPSEDEEENQEEPIHRLDIKV